MRFPLSPLTLAICSALSPIAYADNAENPAVLPEVKLNTIVVEAEKANEVGQTIYSKEDLEKTPNSSKNITDFLKVNPNVQFSNDHRAAGSQGELKPAEISINGAPTYRNKFIINGVNSTNNVDPLGSGDSYDGQLDNGSQGIALNTDLICSLEVLDSNISAEYGDFTGGVIKATTCAPNTEIGKIHGSITYDYTSSDWADYHFATDEEEDEFAEPSSNNQKDFTKQGISANLYSKLSDNWGINFYASGRQSLIPVMSGLNDPKKVEKDRTNINTGATFFYTPSTDTKLKFGFDYGNLDSINYVTKRLDSRSVTYTETLTLFGELITKLNNSTLTQNISYQTMDNARENDNNLGILWKQTPTKNWSDNPGQGSTSSDINLSQDVFAYSFKNTFDPIKFTNTTHNISFGSGFTHTNASWERLNDTYMYNQSKSFTDKATYSCLAEDILCDSPSAENTMQGQFLTNGKYYQKGTANLSQDAIFLFAENKMEWDKFSARLGLRADYESLAKNLNIAPRTSFNYKPFKSDTLSFTTGWNRYYSNYTLNTELRDETALLEYNLKRTASPEDDWVKTGLSDLLLSNANIRRSELDTPYNDEIVFGINGQVSNINIALKWVNRETKNEITKSRYTTPGTKNTIDHYEYSNLGEAKADIYTLAINNIAPLKLQNTEHMFGFAFDYNEQEKNYNTYVDSFNVNSQTAAEDRDVIYNGHRIKFNERPVENFAQPWTARVSWDVDFLTFPLKISNFLSYKSSYEDTYKLKATNIDGLEIYETETIKPRFSWDLRGTYDFQITKDYKAILGLTINNVTNRHNTYTSQNITDSSNTLKSEIGRQFIADVTFKF